MNKIRNILLITLFGVIFSNVGFSQDNPRILEIRKDFQKWQPIIENELNSCSKFFNYAWGENYQFDKWFENQQNNDSITLVSKVSIIEKKTLGYFVNVDQHSISGDWYIAVDYYYNKKEQLYFVFWRMNTFYAEEPLTVEKRLYFDTNGEVVQELKSIYKMNTKEKIDIGFMDREVDYKYILGDTNFYNTYKGEE